jgi:hypothetical protein
MNIVITIEIILENIKRVQESSFGLDSAGQTPYISYAKYVCIHRIVILFMHTLMINNVAIVEDILLLV